MVIKQAILELMKLESSLSHRLDLLTSIEITARNEETYKACLEIRDEIDYDAEDELERILK